MDVDKPTARKVPISLEELIKQKQQEKQALDRVSSVHISLHLMPYLLRQCEVTNNIVSLFLCSPSS
jgi:hypothetical protein